MTHKTTMDTIRSMIQGMKLATDMSSLRAGSLDSTKSRMGTATKVPIVLITTTVVSNPTLRLSRTPRSTISALYCRMWGGIETTVDRHDPAQPVPHRVVAGAGFSRNLDGVVPVLLPRAVHPVKPVETQADDGKQRDAQGGNVCSPGKVAGERFTFSVNVGLPGCHQAAFLSA